MLKVYDFTGSGNGYKVWLLLRHLQQRGVREIRAYPVREEMACVDTHAVLFTFGADHRGVQRGAEGLCIDAQGDLVAVAGWRHGGPGPAVYVLSPTGLVRAMHALPEDVPVCCAFGEDDSLYVGTAAGHLLRARGTGRTGHVVHAGPGASK